MKKSWLGLIGALITFGFSSYLLITGSSILTLSLSDSSNIPLGTFTTWLGLIALPFIFYFSIRRFREPITKTDRAFALILKILIGLALLWIPISYLLAGNIGFNFSERTGFQGAQMAMKLFWYNTYFTTAAPLVLSLAFGLYSLFRKKS